MLRCTPIISVLNRLALKNMASLGCVARAYAKKRKGKKRRGEGKEDKRKEKKRREDKRREGKKKKRKNEGRKEEKGVYRCMVEVLICGELKISGES